MKLSDLLKEFGDIEIPHSVRQALFTHKDCYNEVIEITKEVMNNFKGDILNEKKVTIILDGRYFILEDKIHSYNASLKIDDYSSIVDQLYYYYVGYGVETEIVRIILDKDISHVKMHEEILTLYLSKMRGLGYVKNFKSKILNELKG